MMIHPIMLYTGLVGFAVPFAFGLAALLTGEPGHRRGCAPPDAGPSLPWFFLSRWGSCWAAAGPTRCWAGAATGRGIRWRTRRFMPWLAAYGLPALGDDPGKARHAEDLEPGVLIGLTYTLCLFGTFLTRSGLVQSVHAFAQSEIFGTIFLSYVLAHGDGASSSGSRCSAPSGRAAQHPALESMVSREASFLLNNWVFMAILVVVFWGTMLPVFSDCDLGAAEIDDRPEVLQHRWTGRLALFLLFLTGVGPLVAWRRAIPDEPAPPVRLCPCRLRGHRRRRRALRDGRWRSGAPRRASGCHLEPGGLRDVHPPSSRSTPARSAPACASGEENGRSPAFAHAAAQEPARYGGYVVHLGVVFVLVGFAGAMLQRGDSWRT